MRNLSMPQLYAETSTGQIKTWMIQVEELPEGYAKITSTYGLLGGKLQEKVEIIKEGKNLGKANETTPWEQACSEARSNFQRKLDKNYTETMPGENGGAKVNLLPMLALDYRKRSHDIIYPAFVQPKLNGIRCLASKVSSNEISFTSRKNKPFPEAVTAHLVEPLLELMERGEVFDGEFYVHDWSFQQIARTVKKERPWKTSLEFHVFDLADTAATFSLRYERLLHGWQQRPHVVDQRVCLVHTSEIRAASEVKTYHDMFVKNGWEGAIIRNAAGLYVFDHRSKDLQKYKEFIDEEFEIVGAEFETITDPETHHELKAVVWVCQTKDGKTFNVRPKGSVADRVRWYDLHEEYQGAKLTVRYQELSEDNKPIFPVGLAVRDYE